MAIIETKSLDMSKPELSILDAFGNINYATKRVVKFELDHYIDTFRDKAVYCNCDNPVSSNFWWYFHTNFSILGLKKLVATYYSPKGNVYRTDYTGGNDDDIKVGIQVPLSYNGDFRSKECCAILDEADIVVSKPPQSLFSVYLDLLIRKGKQFVLLNSLNVMLDKAVFAYIERGTVWAGHKFGFSVMTNADVKDIDIDLGTIFAAGYNISNNIISTRYQTGWFTNIDFAERHKELVFDTPYDLVAKEYSFIDYLNVLVVEENQPIPDGYKGLVGIPLSFLPKCKPKQIKIWGLLIDYQIAKQFDAVGIAQRADERPHTLMIISRLDKATTQDDS